MRLTTLLVPMLLQIGSDLDPGSEKPRTHRDQSSGFHRRSDDDHVSVRRRLSGRLEAELRKDISTEGARRDQGSVSYIEKRD